MSCFLSFIWTILSITKKPASAIILAAVITEFPMMTFLAEEVNLLTFYEKAMNRMSVFCMNPFSRMESFTSILMTKS